MATSLPHLRDFLQKHMRMSHIYQPVMIKELLKRSGEASVRDVAAAFLARDESQLEYYEKITKDMPGRVLAKHGIVERDGNKYRLALDPCSLSAEERLNENTNGLIRDFFPKGTDFSTIANAEVAKCAAGETAVSGQLSSQVRAGCPPAPLDRMDWAASS